MCRLHPLHNQMLHAVGEAYDRTSMSTDIAPDLPALTNGVSIAIRQNLHVQFRSLIYMTTY